MPLHGNTPRNENKEWSQVVRERIARAEARNARRAEGSPFSDEPAELTTYVEAHREAGGRTRTVPIPEKNKEINDEIRAAAGRGQVEGGGQ